MDRQQLYRLGLWRDWLKSIEVDEEIYVSDMDPDTVPLVRTAASKIKKDGFFFRIYTQKGMVKVKRYSEEEWNETSRKVQDFAQDPFEVGAWRDWLRGFTIGEWQTRPLDGVKWKSIRATMALLKKEEGLLFTTRRVFTPEGPRVLIMRQEEKQRLTSREPHGQPGQ